MHVKRNGTLVLNNADRKRFESTLSDVIFMSEHCDATATKMLTTCVEVMTNVWDVLYVYHGDDDGQK